MNEHNYYPPNPGVVDPLLVKPGKTFQREVFKVVTAILLFCVVYLLLLSVAVGIAGCFMAAGLFMFQMIRWGATYFLILIGLALIGVGIFIIVYLFKFVFTRFEDKQPHRVEIFPEDHPRLFDFIRQLTTDTNTPMPKRVYISPGVGACVFYDSSFLSMILPVKKNLEIGLGLVNSLNLSEFKEVLAHEFGHFSQRSMRFGGYIYTLNHIIYNMLYRNRNYTRTLNSLQSIHGIFILTGYLTETIIKMIKFVLRKMYNLINLSERRLSKEMEFHADAVAVSVTGSEIAVSALRRVEFGEMCMEFCTNRLYELADKGQAIENIYELQRSILLFSSEQHQLETINGLPILKTRPLPGVSKSRIQYEDLWSSHPSEEEREARYLEANVSNSVDNRLAWELFADANYLEQKMTKHLVAMNFPAADFTATVKNDELLQELEAEKKKFATPPVFKGYYSKRIFPAVEDTEVWVPAATLEEFYNTDLIDRLNRYLQNRQDLEILEAIVTRQVAVTHFKLDGESYPLSEAGTMLERLSADVDQEAQWLSKRDQEAFQLNSNMAPCEKERLELKDRYSNILLAQEYVGQIEVIFYVIKMKIQEIYAKDDWDMNSLLDVIRVVKSTDNKMKQVMISILDEPVLQEEITDDFKAHINTYLATNYAYLIGNTCSNEELMSTYHTAIRLMDSMDNVFKLLRKKYLDNVVSQCAVHN